MLLAGKLPPIVLSLIAQGISPPPPVSVTFPLTETPLSSTVSASVVVTFPLMVITEAWSGSLVHGWKKWAPFGWQPRPTREPAPAVTFLPTVIVDGELWASKTAPAATLRFPTML